MIETNNYEGKIEIFAKKNMLKGKDIFIESEITASEREIQKIIRDTAREERLKGSNVKIKFLKLGRV